MPEFPREELEEMVQRWLDTNKACEAAGDWKPMADMYTEDAVYMWNVGPKGEFCANGREEIREIALGVEMGGLDGWEYPYEKVLIDDKQGHVVGFWRQVADASRDDGSRYEVAGIGGSWFVYAGDFQWCWQRDWFDFGNAAAVFMEMIKDEKLSPGMQARMERSAQRDLPGHYRIGQAPQQLWEVPS